MPGIAGIISSTVTEKGHPAMGPMVKAMLHEKFYKSGTTHCAALGAAAGWVAHPGSYSDGMPVTNKTKDISLIFSGEHFDPATDVTDLRVGCNGHAREGAAAVLRMYEEEGMKFLERLNGAFSGVIFDQREKKVLLFNDRYGLGRIYFHQNADGFYFASEAKSLLKVLPQLRALDLQSWSEMFVCGTALQDRTLFAGVSLLPPGAVWTFAPGAEPKKESYFGAQTWEAQEPLGAEAYYEKLKETFGRVLPKYFGGAQPLGLSLTGGLDSRMVISWAPSPPYKLKTYTFGGIYRECADVRVARRVAKVSQQYHDTISLNRKFFSEFPALAKRSVYFTDGCMDVSGAVGLFVHSLARELAPVRLTGNYGDEILRGHVAFGASMASQELFTGEFNAMRKKALETFKAEREGNRRSFIAFKQMRWHHYCRLAMEQSQVVVRTPFLDNELVALAYRAPDDLGLNRKLALQLINEGNPALATVPTDRGSTRWQKVVPFKLLQFWQEFMPRAEYMYDYGMPHRMAKMDKALAPLHLERIFLGRQKYYHFRMWYRDELSKYVKDVLLDSRTLSRPYLNKGMVENMVQQHCSGTGNFTLELHKLLTSEIIQRQLVAMQ